MTDGLSHPSWKSQGRIASGSLGDPLLALKRNLLGEWQEADVVKTIKEDELFRDSPPKNPGSLNLAWRVSVTHSKEPAFQGWHGQ